MVSIPPSIRSAAATVDMSLSSDGLGRRRPHLAIDAARQAHVPLVIGGPHWRGRDFYDEYLTREMMPRLTAKEGGVMWLGELAHAAKVRLLEGAAALLMPSGWREPFGLVMIEAMMTGTPV